MGCDDLVVDKWKQTSHFKDDQCHLVWAEIVWCSVSHQHHSKKKLLQHPSPRTWWENLGGSRYESSEAAVDSRPGDIMYKNVLDWYSRTHHPTVKQERNVSAVAKVANVFVLFAKISLSLTKTPSPLLIIVMLLLSWWRFSPWYLCIISIPG